MGGFLSPIFKLLFLKCRIMPCYIVFCIAPAVKGTSIGNVSYPDGDICLSDTCIIYSSMILQDA